MSSFVCSDKHFNSIEAALKENLTLNVPLDPIDGMTDKEVEEFVTTLANLNQETVCIERKEPITIDKRVKTKTVSLNSYALLKALHCTEYQINPRAVERVRPLTNLERHSIELLNKLIHKLEYKIVSSLPAYNMADWEVM